MRTTWRMLLALLVVLGFMASACGDDDEGADTGDTTTTEGGGDTSTTGGGSGTTVDISTLGLVEDGTLTVCSDIPYSPFEFEDEDNPGEYTGFDVDLVDAVAESLGLETTYRVTVFDTILGSLAAGDCDMVASAMTITDERKQEANFSQPYYNSQQSLLVRSEDAEKFATLADMGGATIGVQTGTTGADYANENKPEGATIREYEGGEQLFVALQSQEIDAALQDLPVNGYRASQDDAFVVTDSFGTEEQYGFAFAKDNEALLTAFDNALSAAIEDGTYDTIFEQWFGDAPGSINS